jgi:hypothetical protein
MSATFSSPSNLPTARRDFGAEALKLHDEVRAPLLTPAVLLVRAKSSRF